MGVRGPGPERADSDEDRPTTGYEVAVGLREPKKTPDRFLALEVIEQKGHKAKGRILRKVAAA